MKIELKNIKLNLAFSEETTMFEADIFVNGIKVGYAENDGHGGSTDFNRYPSENDTNWTLLKQAIAYAQSLPPISVSIHNNKTFTIESNLENIIDGLVDKHIKELEKKKFETKINKAMLNHIVWGVPNGSSFKQWGFKGITLCTVLQTTNGVEATKNLYDKIKLQLKDGEVIFNKDLVEMFETVKA